MTARGSSDAAGTRSRPRALISWVRGKMAKFKEARLGRALERYSRMRGDVLAGGVAYQGLMSIGAAVVLGSTVTAFVVGRSPSLRDAMLGFLDRSIPGIVDTGTVGGGGLIDASSLSAGPVTGIVGVFALIVGLNTASGWLGALRASTRAMLGSESKSPLHAKARDVLALAALGTIALLAAALQVAAASAAAWLGPDQPGRAWVVRGVALAMGLAADAFFLVIALVVLGGAGRPYRRVVPAIVGATIGIAILRSASTLVLGASVGNPILAPFAAVITVLVWVDLVTRLTLLAAAWVGAAAPPRAT